MGSVCAASTVLPPTQANLTAPLCGPSGRVPSSGSVPLALLLRPLCARSHCMVDRFAGEHAPSIGIFSWTAEEGDQECTEMGHTLHLPPVDQTKAYGRRPGQCHANQATREIRFQKLPAPLLMLRRTRRRTVRSPPASLRRAPASAPPPAAAPAVPGTASGPAAVAGPATRLGRGPAAAGSRGAGGPVHRLRRRRSKQTTRGHRHAQSDFSVSKRTGDLTNQHTPFSLSWDRKRRRLINA